MDDIGHTDLQEVFSELEVSADWNSSPGKAATAIANLHGFYVKILRLCRNGVLPRERMRTALCNLDGRQDIFGVRHYKWNFDSKPTPVVAQNICGTIRVGASKLRELKQSGKKYVHAMIGQSKDNAELINELIDMITLANSPNTEAMVVARQFSHVDDTGCCMEIFDRVLTGALTRPLRHDSSNESLVADVSEVPGPGVNPKDMRSSDNVAETDLDTQTTTEDTGSAGTNEAVKLEPEGVDTAHAGLTNVVADGSIFNTSRVAEQPPVTPQSKPSCTIGIELDRPSTEKTEDAGKLGPDDTRPLEDFGKSSVPAMIDTWMSQDRSKKGTPRKMIDTWKRILFQVSIIFLGVPFFERSCDIQVSIIAGTEDLPKSSNGLVSSGPNFPASSVFSVDGRSNSMPIVHDGFDCGVTGGCSATRLVLKMLPSATTFVRPA